MAGRRFTMILLAVCLCLSLTLQVGAASWDDAKEPIATDAACTLTLYYGYEGTHFPNQTVKLYQVATVSGNYVYTLTAPFAHTGLVLNGIRTNGEWDVIRMTLESLVLSENIAPTSTVQTNAAGQATFEDLEPGLYLASPVHVLQDGLCCAFASALVVLPGLGEDGLWQYQVMVSAKPEILPPTDPNETLEYKVLKLWKGDKTSNTRPQSIQVEIFRDGISYGVVVLSQDNNWSYSWSAKNDGADWKVTERDVPAGYTMTVEQRETTFTLTNIREDAPKPPPPTGDSANILLYALLMFVSGAMLILLPILGKRNRYEERN